MHSPPRSPAAGSARGQGRRGGGAGHALLPTRTRRRSCASDNPAVGPELAPPFAGNTAAPARLSPLPFPTRGDRPRASQPNAPPPHPQFPQNRLHRPSTHSSSSSSSTCRCDQTVGTVDVVKGGAGRDRGPRARAVHGHRVRGQAAPPGHQHVRGLACRCVCTVVAGWAIKTGKGPASAGKAQGARQGRGPGPGNSTRTPRSPNPGPKPGGSMHANGHSHAPLTRMPLYAVSSPMPSNRAMRAGSAPPSSATPGHGSRGGTPSRHDVRTKARSPSAVSSAR